MTLLGKPAVNRGARRTLEQNCGKRGKGQVAIEMVGVEFGWDVVVLRWDPPENTT